MAIVDFDVHHGNGTEASFRGDDSVLFVSLHQWPFYPGTGGPGTSDETTLNLPLPAGSGDAEYRAAFEAEVEPAVRGFAPDILLVSAGFDAHEEDPLASMEVTTAGFRELAERCASLAPRVAAVLEGGYNLETLPGSLRRRTKVFRPRRGTAGFRRPLEPLLCCRSVPRKDRWLGYSSLSAASHRPRCGIRIPRCRGSAAGEGELLERVAA